MTETKEEIKARLREKYCGLENSGVHRQTFYDWETNGLPKPIKKFFEIAKKSNTDPWVLFNLLSDTEKC